MLGTTVNALAIVVGGALGLLLRRGISEKYQITCMHALGMCVALIGIAGALETDMTLLMVCSLVIGGIAGEALRIEHRIESLGKWIEKKVSKGTEGEIARGFVTTSLVVCVGSMAIIGALESGLSGNHQTLFVKAMLDGVLAVIFASTLGAGVLLAAVPLFLYQGAIAMGAGFLRPVLTQAVIGEVSAVGGVLILAIGLNTLGVMGEKRIRVGNLLPAMLVPCVYFGINSLLF